MSIIIKTNRKEIVLISRCYFTKKFQGLGVLFDCDVPQGSYYSTLLLVKVKLFFISYWLSVDIKKRVEKSFVVKNRLPEVFIDRLALLKILDRQARDKKSG